MKIIVSICIVLICLSGFGQNSISWKMTENIASNSFGNSHPRMALDGKGNPMVIWGRMSDGSVMFVGWNGSAFTTPVKLNPTWLKVATASWMGPDIASKGDTVYVVVKRTPESSDTNHIFLLRSLNGGVSFDAPVRVDDIADSISRFPTVTVDALGNPIVAFMKFNSSFLESRWVVARSTDFGKTFSKDVKASGYSGVNAEVCDCCPGAIVSSGNVTAMLYRDNLNNIRDIWTGISTNNNQSFSSGYKSDNTNWMIMSCPSSGPDGVIVGDSLYSVFLSGGNGSYRTYLSTSSVSGKSLGSVKRLTGNMAGLGQQNYPRIASYGSAMAIVWRQTVNGSVQLPLLFTRDIQNGFNTNTDTVDLGDITNMDVALGDRKIYVVWQDDNSATVKFRSGSYSPITAIKDIDIRKPIEISPNPVNYYVHLSSDNGYSGIRIVNILGETVYLQNEWVYESQTLDISFLEKGLYFIQVQIGEETFTYKLIKE